MTLSGWFYWALGILLVAAGVLVLALKR